MVTRLTVIIFLMYLNVDLLNCTPETNITSYVNYTLIKNNKNKVLKIKNFGTYDQEQMRKALSI